MKCLLPIIEYMIVLPTRHARNERLHSLFDHSYSNSYYIHRMTSTTTSSSPALGIARSMQQASQSSKQL